MAGRRKRTVSMGTCALCGETLSKQAMGRHVASCLDRKTPKSERTARGRAFHVVVEGGGLAPYWLHVEARADATLRDLDRFLRDTWLECCGHLSAFHIGGVTYDVERDPESPDRRTMNVPLGRVLAPGLIFAHEYDFGSTTELRLRVSSERPAPARGKRVRLLARNLPPPILCVSCGKPAQQLCAQCIWNGDGVFCAACVRKHPCEEEMRGPIANSPRTGVCGY